MRRSRTRGWKRRGCISCNFNARGRSPGCPESRANSPLAAALAFVFLSTWAASYDLLGPLKRTMTSASNRSTAFPARLCGSSISFDPVRSLAVSLALRRTASINWRDAAPDIVVTTTSAASRISRLFIWPRHAGSAKGDDEGRGMVSALPARTCHLKKRVNWPCLNPRPRLRCSGLG